jgi:hypothetical protein
MRSHTYAAMKLWHMFLALCAVWISVVGSMAHDSEVAYTVSVKEATDVPPGVKNISPEERIEVIAAFNDNLLTTATNPA